MNDLKNTRIRFILELNEEEWGVKNPIVVGKNTLNFREEREEKTTTT